MFFTLLAFLILLSSFTGLYSHWELFGLPAFLGFFQRFWCFRSISGRSITKVFKIFRALIINLILFLNTKVLTGDKCRWILCVLPQAFSTFRSFRYILSCSMLFRFTLGFTVPLFRDSLFMNSFILRGSCFLFTAVLVTWTIFLMELLRLNLIGYLANLLIIYLFMFSFNFDNISGAFIMILLSPKFHLTFFQTIFNVAWSSCFCRSNPSTSISFIAMFYAVFYDGTLSWLIDYLIRSIHTMLSHPIRNILFFGLKIVYKLHVLIKTNILIQFSTFC